MGCLTLIKLPKNGVEQTFHIRNFERKRIQNIKAVSQPLLSRKAPNIITVHCKEVKKIRLKLKNVLAAKMQSINHFSTKIRFGKHVLEEGNFSYFKTVISVFRNK